MKFHSPYKVYTAANNFEAHQIVGLLNSESIEAYAVEVQSAAGLWELGTLSQIHQPNVWVDQSDAERAAKVINAFEAQRRRREQSEPTTGELSVTCETCGATSQFSSTMNGSTQICPHCRAYVDVGEIPWTSEGHAC